MNHERVRRLQEELGRAGVGRLWVEPSVGFTYLTGLEPISIERLTGLVVPAQGDLRLVVPQMLEQECASIEAETFAWTDSQGPEDAARRALAGTQTLHIQGSLPAWAWELLRRAAGVEIAIDPGALAGLRARKDGDEMDALRRSAQLTDEVVVWAAGRWAEAATERRLAGMIAAHYLERGARPSDVPLVASGAHAAMPHYAGEDIPIASDAPLLLDIGCAVDGYWSDITRVFFPGVAGSEVEDVYGVVLDAYDAAAATAASGVPCEEVDRAARRVIESAGYGDAFIHRTGHGVGLEMHEAPYIREGNAEPLQTGNVFSIEPGVYLPGRFGLRYENLVAVTASGLEVLNHAPRRNPLPTPTG